MLPKVAEKSGNYISYPQRYCWLLNILMYKISGKTLEDSSQYLKWSQNIISTFIWAVPLIPTFTS